MSTLNELRSRLSQAPSRLLLGISIMLASGLFANNLIEMNDSTAINVFVASSDLAAGQRLETSTLTEATLSQSVDVSQWFTQADIKADMYLATSLNKGEVLRKSDVVLQSSNLTSVNLLIQRGRIPATLKVGDAVDVWDVVQPTIPIVEQVNILGIEVLSGEIALTLLVPTNSIRELLKYQELAITAKI